MVISNCFRFRLIDILQLHEFYCNLNTDLVDECALCVNYANNHLGSRK